MSMVNCGSGISEPVASANHHFSATDSTSFMRNINSRAYNMLFWVQSWRWVYMYRDVISYVDAVFLYHFQ